MIGLLTLFKERKFPFQCPNSNWERLVAEPNIPFNSTLVNHFIEFIQLNCLNGTVKVESKFSSAIDAFSKQGSSIFKFGLNSCGTQFGNECNLKRYTLFFKKIIVWIEPRWRWWEHSFSSTGNFKGGTTFFSESFNRISRQWLPNPVGGNQWRHGADPISRLSVNCVSNAIRREVDGAHNDFSTWERHQPVKRPQKKEEELGKRRRV